MRVILFATALALAATPASAITVFSASGPTAADIQGTVDAYRAALGVNNGVLPGSQGGGRREINWDGGGAAAPATQFGNPMSTFSGRGVTFSTPGVGFEISGQFFPEFGDIDPAYPDMFTPFSAPRIFAPLGATTMDVLFNVPGGAEAARTNAFGAVFLDADLPDVSGLSFFATNGAFLGSFNVAPAPDGLSFLGVIFDTPNVARVRITTGNAPLGFYGGGVQDFVALDDFIFGEPTSGVGAVVPEPESWALLILGFGLTGATLRRFRAAPATIWASGR